MQLEDFEISRGFRPGELAAYGVRAEGGQIHVPILGRDGAWYERLHRPQGTPKYESPKGVASHLINPLGLGPHSGEVWIAEGEWDTYSLVVSGVPACGILGVGNFHRNWALLFEGAEIVLALDPDDAGNAACEKLAQLWPAGQVTRFDPSPHPDLNAWFMADREDFEAAVREW